MAAVYESAVIPATIEEVWQVIRDFNALPDWHPAIATSEIEEGRPGDAVGCVRRFTLTDGAVLREQLVGLSDEEHRIAYRMLDSPMPLWDYLAELRLQPVTLGGRTFATWAAGFAVGPIDEVEVTGTVRGVFEGGLRSLEQRFG